MVLKKVLLRVCIYLSNQDTKAKKQCDLLGSGTILREVLAAADILEKDFNIGADIYSVTSFMS